MVSEHDFCCWKCHFWHPNILKIAVFNAISKSWVEQKWDFSSQKHVLRPLYNRYFCHITVVNWSGRDSGEGSAVGCSGTSGNFFNSNFQSLWLIVEICRSSPVPSDKIVSLERHISKFYSFICNDEGMF